MRKPLLISLLALTGALLVGAGVANSGPVAVAIYQEIQPATRGLPDGGCGAGGMGADISYVSDVHVVVQCGDHSQFTAGSMLSYFCDTGVGGWAKGATSNDFTIPTIVGQFADGGYLASMGPELLSVYPFGRVWFATSGAACNGASWDGGVIVNINRAQR